MISCASDMYVGCVPVITMLSSSLAKAHRCTRQQGARSAYRAPAVVVRAMSTTDSAKSAVTTELRNAGPDPKKFTVTSGQLAKIAAASFPFLARFGTGGFASGYKSWLVPDDGKYGVATVGGRRVSETSKVGTFKRPVQPIELYEFQGCPFCRKVREAVSILDLDVTVYPTPKGGIVWRPKAVELGGKAQFPFLVDNNTGKQLYESDEIIKYLFTEYGDGQVPLALKLGFATVLTCGLALAPRAGAGSRASPSKQPAEPLVLWAYELSPFVVLVKEKLCELELPYKQVTCSRGSPKRQDLLDKRGHFQVPYLEDPNTGVYMFESAAIMKYLQDTYAV